MPGSSEDKLQSAYRRLLRLVSNYYYKRDGDVSWAEWVQHATHKAEDFAHKHGLTGWVVEQRRRKFRWVGKVARVTDGRWTHAALFWFLGHGKRGVGRPRRRSSSPCRAGP